MAKSKNYSKSLQRLMNKLKVQQYDTAEDVLKVAREHGMGSRTAIYLALAYAYQWHLMSINNKSYMMQKFKSNDISTSDNDKKNLFIPTIKLVFDFIESRYASRVTEYALVLQYIDRKLDQTEYVNQGYLPLLITDLINNDGGVRKCANSQRDHNNDSDDSDNHTPTEKKGFIQKACTKYYNQHASLSKIDVQAPPSSTGFVLMMGRVDPAGGIDIVDVMDAGEEEIYNLTKDGVMNDTSTLSDTLNLIGDTLGYLNAFGVKETPIATVEKGGDVIYLSQNKNEDASIVVKAKPKDQTILSGFKNRAHMSMKNKKWFKENAQARDNRHMYNLKVNSTVKTSEVAYDLISRINQTTKVMHFNAMTPDTVEQIITKSIPSNDWIISVDLSREEIDYLYSWTKRWLSINRPSAADRIIEITINQNDILFDTGNGDSGSEKKQLVIATGYQGKDKKYRVFGRELVKVIEQVWLNPSFEKLTLRFPDKGLVEILAEDTIAEYIIDIPTVLKGDVNHNPMHFVSLQ